MPDQYLAMTADPSHEESFHVPTQVSNDVMHGPYIKFMLGMHCHIVWTQQSRQESAGQYSARRHGQCTMPLAGVNQRQRGRRSDGFLVHCTLIRQISMPFSQFLQVSYIILISQSRLHHPRCSQDFVNYVIRTLGCVGWQHVFSAFMH